MYFCLTITTDSEVTTFVTKALNQFRNLGMIEAEVNVEPGKNVLAIESEFINLIERQKPEKKKLKVYFESETDLKQFECFVLSQFPNLQLSSEQEPNKDWHIAWQKHYKPIQIETLKIVPAWNDAAPSQSTIKIMPGQAFGAGSHETTKLCIKAMHCLPRQNIATALDFGSGTGILLLAAARLFPLTLKNAVEIDPPALELINRNFRLNELSIDKIGRSLPDQGKYDLITANILAPVLLANEKAIRHLVKQDSYLILSGILTAEKESFMRIFNQSNFWQELDHKTEGEWSVVTLFPR